jgi:hypothetical protein
MSFIARETWSKLKKTIYINICGFLIVHQIQKFFCDALMTKISR